MEEPTKLFQKVSDADLRNIAKLFFNKVLYETDLLKKLQLLLFALQQLVKVKEKKEADHNNISIYCKKFYDLVIDYCNSKQKESDKLHKYLRPMYSYIEVLKNYSKENPTENIQIKESHLGVLVRASLINGNLENQIFEELTIYEKELQDLTINLNEENNNVSKEKLNKFLTKLCETINEKLSLLSKPPLLGTTDINPRIGEIVVRIMHSVSKYFKLLDKNSRRLFKEAIEYLWGKKILQIKTPKMWTGRRSPELVSDSHQREIAKEFYQKSLNEPNLLKRLQLLVSALQAIVTIKEKTEIDDEEAVNYSITFQELAKSYLFSAAKQNDEEAVLANFDLFFAATQDYYTVQSLVDDVFSIIKNYSTEHTTKISSIQTCYQDLIHLKFAYRDLEELLQIAQVDENKIVQMLSLYHAAKRLIETLTDENKAAHIAKINDIAESLFAKALAILDSSDISSLQFNSDSLVIQDIVNFFNQNSQILHDKNAQLGKLCFHILVASIEDDKSISTESKVEDGKLALTESVEKSFQIVENAFPNFSMIDIALQFLKIDKQVNLTQRSIFEQFLEQLTTYVESININKTRCTIKEYQKVIDYNNKVNAYFLRFFRQDREIIKKCAIAHKQIFILMEESAGSNLFDATEILSMMYEIYHKELCLFVNLGALAEILSTAPKMADSIENLSIKMFNASRLSLTTEQQSLLDPLSVELLETLEILFNRIISFKYVNKIKSEDVLLFIDLVIPYVDDLLRLGVQPENWSQINRLSAVFQKIYNNVMSFFSSEDELGNFFSNKDALVILVKKALEIEHIRLGCCYQQGDIERAVEIFLQFIRNKELDNRFFSNLERYLIICTQYFKMNFSSEKLALIEELAPVIEDKPTIMSLLLNFYNGLFHHFKKENQTVEAEIFYNNLINMAKKIPNEQNIKAVNEATILYGLNISALNLEPYHSNKIIQNLTESKDVLTKNNLSNISLQQGQWQKIETVTGIWYGLVIAETEVKVSTMQRQDFSIPRKIFIDELAKILKDKNPDVIVVDDTLFLRPNEAFLNQLSGKSSDWRMSFLAALTEKMRPQDEARIKFNPDKKLHRKGDFSQPLFNERKPKKSSSGKSAKLPKPNVGKASKKEKSVAKKSESPKKVQQLPKPAEYINPGVEEFLANPPRIVTTTKKVRKPATPSPQTSTLASSSTTQILTTLSSPDSRHETQEATVLTQEKEVAPIAQPEHLFLKAATHFRQQLEADLGNAKDARDNQDIAIQKLNFQIDILQFILALNAYSYKQPKTTQYEDYRKSWERIRRSLAHSNAELAGFQEMAKLITEKFPFTVTELPNDLIDFNRRLEALIDKDFRYDYGTPKGCIAVIGKQFFLMQPIIKPFSTDPKTLLHNFSTGADRHLLHLSIDAFALYKERYTAMIGCLIKLGEAYARLLECCQNDKQEILWENVHQQLLRLNPHLHLNKFKEFLNDCKNYFRNPACHESDPTISDTGLLFDPDQVINAYLDSLTFTIPSINVPVDEQEVNEQKITEKDGKNEEHKPRICSN